MCHRESHGLVLGQLLGSYLTRKLIDDRVGDLMTGEETFPPSGSDLDSATHVHDAVGGEDELADDTTDGKIDATRDADLRPAGGRGLQDRDISVQDQLIVDEGASSDDALAMAREIALHIASAAPRYLTRDDVPADVVEAERQTLETITLNEGKPEAAVPKIVEGRLNGFFKDICLLEQVFIRDDGKDRPRTIDDLVKEQITKTGENMVVRRFARFELGESLGQS